MQLIFVGLAYKPMPALIALMLVEAAFIALTLSLYFKNGHLNSCLLMVPRVLQSLMIMAVEAILLW